ncbi:hypothetical protein STEG23_013129 [Scotinomys teguina]
MSENLKHRERVNKERINAVRGIQERKTRKGPVMFNSKPAKPEYEQERRKINNPTNQNTVDKRQAMSKPLSIITLDEHDLTSPVKRCRPA